MAEHRVLKMWVLLLLLAGPHSALGACDSEGYRQFDFWLGQWQVHTPEGELAGVNDIRSEYDGCVIHERYSSERGYRGESLNIYDASRDVWHQSWVDNTGLLLLLEGGISGDSMVLKGQTLGENDQVTHHRITWTPGPDGSVRQLWESTDAGGQWQTAFDGRYTQQ